MIFPSFMFVNTAIVLKFVSFSIMKLAYSPSFSPASSAGVSSGFSSAFSSAFSSGFSSAGVSSGFSSVFSAGFSSAGSAAFSAPPVTRPRISAVASFTAAAENCSVAPVITSLSAVWFSTMDSAQAVRISSVR